MWQVETTTQSNNWLCKLFHVLSVRPNPCMQLLTDISPLAGNVNPSDTWRCNTESSKTWRSSYLPWVHTCLTCRYIHLKIWNTLEIQKSCHLPAHDANKKLAKRQNSNNVNSRQLIRTYTNIQIWKLQRKNHGKPEKHSFQNRVTKWRQFFV